MALYIRNEAHSIKPEQLSDLGDAIHNVPESLTEYGGFFDERMIREIYSAAYDQKWSRSEDAFSLLRTLDAGIEIAEQWLREERNWPQ